MAGRRLLIHWDPELDGPFRRRLERALGELHVDHVDAAAVDHDPDIATVSLAVASARGGAALPSRVDLVILGGPDEFPPGAVGCRLDARDIEDNTVRWTRFTEQARVKLGLTSIALPAEELEVRLAQANERADASERARNRFELDLNAALQRASRLEAELAKTRSDLARLSAQHEQLQTLHRMSAFTLASVEPAARPVVSQAREHAARAVDAAARATEMAARHPGALAWGKTAVFSGETQNHRPHGHGVMEFMDGAGEVVASFRGQFRAGQRSGHGVGVSRGYSWAGEWKDDEACGLGVLETPDGRRFDGEVAPGPGGAPRRVDGALWEPGQSAPRGGVMLKPDVRALTDGRG